jgi:hypothetical protein
LSGFAPDNCFSAALGSKTCTEPVGFVNPTALGTVEGTLSPATLIWPDEGATCPETTTAGTAACAPGSAAEMTTLPSAITTTNTKSLKKELLTYRANTNRNFSYPTQTLSQLFVPTNKRNTGRDKRKRNKHLFTKGV